MTFFGGLELELQLILMLVAAVGVAVSIYLITLIRRAKVANAEIAGQLRSATARLDGITDLDEEKASVQAQILQKSIELGGVEALYQERLENAQAEHAAALLALNQKLAELRFSYGEKRAVYDRLLGELAIFDERLAFAEMGVYQPHFDFSDSESYKAAINEVRDRQKDMVSRKTAVFGTKEWTVDGSLAKGQTMTNRGIRMTLRAFNNECDAAIANTRWNNVNAMEKRILRAKEQIDKLNASNAIEIGNDYFDLKLTELRLTHEYREKQKAEREERAEMARAAREEQKLLRDMEQAQEDEEHYAKLLEKAKAEAAGIIGTKLDAFEDQIKTLEKDLAEAHARFERAQAMAERTRSGYVYIISNIGSFGNDIVKIGLTRRLDPLDRVRELGDASVPFLFDTHAIIYSDDAPALERALHAQFESTRINTQNYRKEFFKANIDHVEDAVRRLAPGASFFRDVEAQEYRETLARRDRALADLDMVELQKFPSAI